MDEALELQKEMQNKFQENNCLGKKDILGLQYDKITKIICTKKTPNIL